MILRIVVASLLSGLGLIGWGCSSSPQSARALPLSPSTRRVLKVCASKDKLTRSDLTALAHRYSVMYGNDPSLVEILKLNEKCRTAPDAEQLDLSRPECASANKDECKTGIVLVPIR